MKEGSLLKRTIVVTGLLVGVSTLWVALVSVTAVTVVDHAISRTPVREVVVPATTAPKAATASNKATSPAPSSDRGATPNG